MLSTDMAFFRDLTKIFDDLRSVLWELKRIYAFQIACKKGDRFEIGYLHLSHRSFDNNKYRITCNSLKGFGTDQIFK